MYLWIKAAHVVAILSWMAGMLYLPRLFVYHAEAQPGSVLSETFKVMERRLLKAIMTPAMVAAWGFGLWLAGQGGHWSAPWFHAKFALVVFLSGIHGYLAMQVRRFAEDRNSSSSRFFRILNEVPTVAMILVVTLVVVKPF